MVATEGEITVVTQHPAVHPTEALQTDGLRLIVGTNHGRGVLQDQLKVTGLQILADFIINPTGFYMRNFGFITVKYS